MCMCVEGKTLLYPCVFNQALERVSEKCQILLFFDFEYIQAMVYASLLLYICRVISHLDFD
jgi:hypothetical protein